MTDDRRRIFARRALSTALLVVGLALLVPPAQAGIYKYVDRDGVSHYTDSMSQVPFEYRGQVRDISPDMEDMTNFRIVEGLNDDSPGAKQGDEFSADFDTDFEAGDIDLGGFESDMVSSVLDTLGFGVILLFLLAIPVLYVVSALVFKLACRIAGEDPPGLGRACGILLAQGLAGSAAGAAVSGVGMALGVDQEASIGAAVAVTGSSSLISWLVNAAILQSMMSYSFVRSMWIGVLHTLLVLVMIGGPIGAIALIAFMAA
jgi:hypothetical protein